MKSTDKIVQIYLLTEQYLVVRRIMVKIQIMQLVGIHDDTRIF